MAMSDAPIEINVGGQVFMAKRSTLCSQFPESRLSTLITTFDGSQKTSELLTDSQGRLFIDRDPKIFVDVLQYLRDLSSGAEDGEKSGENQSRWLSHLSVKEKTRLEDEFAYFKISPPAEFSSAFCHFSRPVQCGSVTSESNVSVRTYTRNLSIRRPVKGPNYISVGYRATYEASRDAMSNDKFRRITRITVCGNAAAAKEVFCDDLNESRDPDRASTGYTSRYYLKHNHLEKAFEALSTKGYELAASTSSGSKSMSSQSDEHKQWTAYIDYVFYRKESERVLQ